MKTICLLLLTFFTATLAAQDVTACGADDNPVLSPAEASFLNGYLSDSRGNFDFTGKKVLFMTETSGHRINTKSRYFQDVKDWQAKNSKVATTLVLLSPQEKITSGGYDVMVVSWCKLITKRRIKKNIALAATL